MVSSSSRRRGIALLDAIVAAVILGVALAAIIGLANQAVISQATGERLAIAARLADEQLNLVLARGPDSYASRFKIDDACDAPFQDFRYQLAFTGGGSDVYRVVCTISWPTGSGDRSIAIETMIAPRVGDDPDPDRRPAAAVERPQ